MSVRILAVNHVTNPFAIKVDSIKVVNGGFHHDASIIHPPHFFSLGAVGWYAVHVVEDGAIEYRLK